MRSSMSRCKLRFFFDGGWYLIFLSQDVHSWGLVSFPGLRTFILFTNFLRYANVLLAVLNGRKRARRLVALTHHSLSLHFAEHIPSRFSSTTLQEALMGDPIMRSSQVSV